MTEQRKKLTKHAKQCLEKWHRDRSFDISSYRRRMGKRGLKINEKAAEFLTSFGGLFVFNQKGLSIMDFHFNAFEASRGLRPEEVLENERILNTSNLSVIGCCDDDRPIFMDEDGVVYGAGDGYYHLIGQTGFEAINNLCSATNIIELQGNKE